MKTSTAFSTLCTTFFLAAAAYSQNTPTNGLIAYYPFNGNAIDVSGNGKDGSVQGATLTTNRFGNANSAYAFTGGQYIDLPIDCSSQKPLTYSLWINQATPSSFPAQSLVWTGTFDAEGYDLGIWYATNILYGEFFPSGKVFTAFTVSQNTWIHVVETFAESATIYVNGVQIAQADCPSPAGFRSSITRIGRSQDFYVNGFEGVIDDLRIYNRAISSEEIAQLYALESDSPSITAQPQPQTGTLGGTVTLAVSATDTNALFYQWSLEGASIPGATNATLLITNIQPKQIGYYSVTINNGINTITSTQAAVNLVGYNFSQWRGLIAYYPFNGNANDLTGNGHDGNVINAALATDRFGSQNSAYFFNGSNAFIQTTNFYPSIGSNAVSAACWIYYDGGIPAPFAESTMLNWGGVSYYGARFEFRLLDAGNGVTSLTVDAGSVAIAQTAIASHKWIHLVAVKPLNGGINDVMFYVDGAQVPTVQQGNNYIYNLAPNDTLTLGRGSLSETGVNRCFFGLIDDVRIYNRALSSKEVTQLYAYESRDPRVGLVKAVKPSFSNLIIGTNYLLQVSGDLTTWTNQGSAFTATNDTMVYPQYYDVEHGGQLYFRLQQQ